MRLADGKPTVGKTSVPGRPVMRTEGTGHCSSVAKGSREEQRRAGRTAHREKEQERKREREEDVESKSHLSRADAVLVKRGSSVIFSLPGCLCVDGCKRWWKGNGNERARMKRGSERRDNVLGERSVEGSRFFF